ncbi:MAG: UDP-glucose--hexose-1-phosphate uridylyltransferase [Beduini sp.]
MHQAIQQLVNFALKEHLIEKEDEIYCINQLLALMQEVTFKKQEVPAYTKNSAEELLNQLVTYAIQKGIIEDTTLSKEAFDTKLMNVLTPRPSEVIRTFNQLLQQSSKKATDYYYHLAKSSNYIRQERVAKDKHWVYESEFGLLDITINLSKPEKDPKDIAMQKNNLNTNYPKCLLCKENVGYGLKAGHPSRDQHRIIPFTLDHQTYYMQYSPYVYYNEHCIVFNENHTPMKIDYHTFNCLLDFCEQLPHYFIGSNADLPIVGGSILSHDHFQGGHYDFAMAKASTSTFKMAKNFKKVTYAKVHWPLSVIRARSTSKTELAKFADEVLSKWINYSNQDIDIIAFSDARHNTITPIARKKSDYYEMDLVLRNNRTTQKYPLGIFHPHAPKHHIKKENIGLIEVMGLAVLPSRLDRELTELKRLLLQNETELPESLKHHQQWYDQLRQLSLTSKNIDETIEQEVGRIFLEVLKDAGVFKLDQKGQEAFDGFLNEF